MKALAPLAILVALMTPAHAETPLKGWSGPKPIVPCRCRHAQGKAALGETICRRLNGKMVTLRCDKVLNNTSWTKIGDGCAGKMSHPGNSIHRFYPAPDTDPGPVRTVYGAAKGPGARPGQEN